MATLFSGGPRDVRVTVYTPKMDQVLTQDASAYFGGGQIQYEETPSGCGAATLQMGLTPELTFGLGYFGAMNVVEISTGDDVLQVGCTLGATKLYVASTLPYDVTQGEDTPLIYLWDGFTLTMRVPVTGVGTDGGGPFITVGAPLGGGVIPPYLNGTLLGRRRYTGRIIRRSKPNQKQPLLTLNCVGLINTLDQGLGTFPFTNYDVGKAIYQSLLQFASRWPFLTISAGNFPTVGSTYTGNSQGVFVSRVISDALSAIANGDLWVVRVGHDRVVRLIKLYDGTANTYVYSTALQQGVTNFEVVAAEVDDDASQLTNTQEVDGGTDPNTKQQIASVVQDLESIDAFYQIDASPVSNPQLPSFQACASAATAILNQNSQPRSNNQLRVFTRNDVLVVAGLAPRGLSNGDVVRGFDNVVVSGFSGIGSVINCCIDSEILLPGPALSTTDVAISASGSPQAITCESTEFLSVGMSVSVGTGTDEETVTITAVSPLQFSAIFTKNHAKGAAVFQIGAQGLWTRMNTSGGTPLGWSATGGSRMSPAFTANEAGTSGGMKSRPFPVAPGQSWGISAQLDARNITTGVISVGIASASNPSTIYGHADQTAGTAGIVSLAGIMIPSGETACVVILYTNSGAGYTGFVTFSHPQAQRAGASVDPYVPCYGTLDEYGLVASAQTTISPGRDSQQDIKFSAIEPDWLATVSERANALANAARQGLINGPGLDQYFVSVGAWTPRIASLLTNVTGSGSPQTVPVDSYNGLMVGGTYAVGTGSTLELVQITGIGPVGYITGVFHNNHAVDSPVWGGVSGAPSPDWGYPATLTVTLQQFQAVFALGSGPVLVGANSFTLPPNTTSWAWLNPNNTWTINSSFSPTVAGAILFAIFQTDSSGVVGATLKAPLGYLGIPGTYNLPSGAYVPTQTSVAITETVPGQLVSQVKVAFTVTNQPRNGSLAKVNCWYRQTGQTFWLLLASSPVCDATGTVATRGELPGTGEYTFLFPDAANGIEYDFGYTMVDTENGETALASGTSGTGWLGQITTSDAILGAENLVSDSRWATSKYVNGKSGANKYWYFFNIDGNDVCLLQGADPQHGNNVLAILVAGASKNVTALSDSVAVTTGQSIVAQAHYDCTSTSGTSPQTPTIALVDTTGQAPGHHGSVLASASTTYGQAGTVSCIPYTVTSGVKSVALLLTYPGGATITNIFNFSEGQIADGAAGPLPYNPTAGPSQGQQENAWPLQPYVVTGCLTSLPFSSLTATNPGGVIVVGGQPITVPPQTLTYPPSSTLYDFVDDSGIIQTSTSVTPPSGSAVLLQAVVTSGGAIIGISDERIMPGSGQLLAFNPSTQQFGPVNPPVGSNGWSLMVNGDLPGPSFMSDPDGQPVAVPL